MFDFIGLIKSGLTLANTLADGDNKEKRFSVAMRKNARKALNVAEDVFDVIEDHMAELPIKTQRKLKKLMKRFDDLD